MRNVAWDAAELSTPQRNNGNSELYSSIAPPKTNMDTQHDVLEKVTPFKNGNYWYLC